MLATLATSRTRDLLAGGGDPSAAVVRDALAEGYGRAFSIGAAIAFAGALVVLAFVRTAGPARRPAAAAAAS